MLETQFQRGTEKRRHPRALELLEGLDLSSRALGTRPDAEQLKILCELLSNAEYWLSFELSGFEPLLARCPSPLRELGVGVALRFSEGIDARLSAEDLSRARAELLPGLPEDVARAVEAGLESLSRAVLARDRMVDLLAEGFGPYQPCSSLSAHAIRAGGRATISCSGTPVEDGMTIEVGAQVSFTATDEKGRPLAAPEIESDLSAPILAHADEAASERALIFLVPGRYRLRAPGRADGGRTIWAR